MAAAYGAPLWGSTKNDNSSSEPASSNSQLVWSSLFQCMVPAPPASALHTDPDGRQWAKLALAEDSTTDDPDDDDDSVSSAESESDCSDSPSVTAPLSLDDFVELFLRLIVVKDNDLTFVGVNLDALRDPSELSFFQQIHWFDRFPRETLSSYALRIGRFNGYLRAEPTDNNTITDELDDLLVADDEKSVCTSLTFATASSTTTTSSPPDDCHLWVPRRLVRFANMFSTYLQSRADIVKATVRSLQFFPKSHKTGRSGTLVTSNFADSSPHAYWLGSPCLRVREFASPLSVWLASFGLRHTGLQLHRSSKLAARGYTSRRCSGLFDLLLASGLHVSEWLRSYARRRLQAYLFDSLRYASVYRFQGLRTCVRL